MVYRYNLRYPLLVVHFEELQLVFIQVRRLETVRKNILKNFAARAISTYIIFSQINNYYTILWHNFKRIFDFLLG